MHNIDLPFDLILMEFIVPKSAIREINIKEVHNDVGSEKEDHHGKGKNYQKIEHELSLDVDQGTLFHNWVDALIHNLFRGHPENYVDHVENQDVIEVQREPITQHNRAVCG